MTRLYMLDTNIISSLVRDPFGPVRRHMEQVGADNLCTSVIAAAELHYGHSKAGSPQLRNRVEKALLLIKVLPFPERAASRYGAIRASLERRGTPIGSNDLWIAAHALAESSILVTDNLREFARVEGLECQNWLKQS